MNPLTGLSMLLMMSLAFAGCSATRAATEPIPPSERVHIFYYNWYGAPLHQPGYRHWQQGDRQPPDDIGADFYPALGAYSSSDPRVLKQHMQWIRQAGTGVIVLSWWGRDSYEDQLTMPVLDAARDAGLKVAFHLEPYDGMTPPSLEADVRYLLDRYGQHPALFRSAAHDHKPMFYIFETLRHPARSWRPVIDRLRAGDQPVMLIAQTTDLAFIVEAGFDGGYPYDVLAPFKDERFLASWPALARAFADAGKLFIPSVGPGYIDDRAVPRGADEPSAATTRDDGTAATYHRAWDAAIATTPQFISITSFNEWHEGTQIEPAASKRVGDFVYRPSREGPEQYLNLTAELVRQFLVASR